MLLRIAVTIARLIQHPFVWLRRLRNRMVEGGLPWPRDLIQITAKEDKVFRDIYGCNSGSALQTEFLKYSRRIKNVS